MRSLQRSVPGALVVATCAVLAACERPGQYAEDADTGAAAPATKREMSPGVQAPDSTTGVSKPVMRGTISGDTTAREEEAQTVPAPPGGSKKPE